MKKTLSALLAFAVVSAPHPACADNSTREYNLELERQPLAATLKDFSRQTGLNTGYIDKTGNAEGIIVGPLKGRYTVEAALTALLAETGLVFKQTNDISISVTSSGSGKAWRKGESGGQISKTANGPKFLHLAEARFADQLTEEVALDRIAAVEDSGETQPRRGELRDRWIDEVVVAGSHIRGVENNTVPVIVLDKAYIDSTGFSTTTALIESLPQNFALNSQSGLFVPEASPSTHQGSSVTLRGVGVGTTLTLLNGRRMASGYGSAAVDISALPLSAIERVEVLTDGASALYGSDAVGGVVNFVLRDDFDGAETRLRRGWADAVDEYRVSQALGSSWDSGNALLALEYYKRELLWAKDRNFVPDASLVGSLLPRDKNYSAMFSGKQNVAEGATLFADALFTQRDSFNFAGRAIPSGNETFDTDNPQTNVTVGLDWYVGGDWQVEAAGSYARNEMELISHGTNTRGHSLFEVQVGQVKLNGPVLRLPGGELSVAVGAEWRGESYSDSSVNLSTGASGVGIDSDQIVRSAFAQVYVPIVGDSNAMVGVRRLEVSLAGRFDDYSNFGSSVDPQMGIMWEPVGGLRFRGSRGSSYKPPNLTAYSTNAISASALFTRDPGLPGATTRSFQLWRRGTDIPSLSPQESQSSSFGVEFAPQFVDGLRVGVNYYSIDYNDRIAAPGTALQILSDPNAFGSLIVRDPSNDQVNEALAFALLGRGLTSVQLPPGVTSFTPELVDVIVDLRTRNLSVTETSGLDVSIHYDFNMMGGNVQLGLDGTHIYELVQQVTSTSAPADRVDTIYNPPDWRVRGSAGWQRQGWMVNLFVNHTDSYKDSRLPARPAISSYTTVDARLAYDFKERSSDFLSGVTVSFSAQNLFDRDPPSTSLAVIGGFDMGFDPTNASPLGRMVSIDIAKVW